MRTLAEFLKAHWGTFLLLVALIVTTQYIVRTKRPPGAMTVIEAQAMDMSQMGTPVGAAPVATEKVRFDWFASTVTYTGSVVAYNDTDIVSRVEGVVMEMPVYPGDRVRPGQLLARLDSRERSARLQEAEAAAFASIHDREAMSREVEQMRAELEESLRRRNSAQAMEQKAYQELEMAQQQLEAARSERDEMQAEIPAAEANLEYWKAEDTRAENLLKAGAIAREERQRTQAEYAKAQAELQRTRVRLTKSEAQLRQAQAMVKAAQAQLQQATQEAQGTQAGVKRASAALAAAQAKLQRSVAMQRQAEASRQAEAIVTDYTRITAPVGGVITERLISPGTLVMPGTVLMRLRTTDRVRIQANVAEADINGIQVGNVVTITTASDPSLRVKTRVTSVFGAVDPHTRTAVVEALFTNNPIKLLPGQYVVMEITKGKPRRAISVPLSAIRRDGKGKPFVWVVASVTQQGKTVYTCVMHPEVLSDKPDTCPKCAMDLVPKERGGKLQAKRVYVTLGEGTGRRIEVLSGLREGDEVITLGNEYLKEGDPVTPVEWGATGPLKLPLPFGETPDPQGTQHQHRQKVAPQGSNQADYVCPMHPEIRSDKPEDCPKCGMKLEKLPGGANSDGGTNRAE